MQRSNNPIDDSELGLGFSMALAQNKQALIRFGEMDESTRKSLIEQTHRINSKSEMQKFVSDISNGAIG